MKLNDNSFTASYSHHEFLVIGHGAKERLVEQVPGDVLHHGGVAREDGLGVHYLSFLWHRADVP